MSPRARCSCMQQTSSSSPLPPRARSLAKELAALRRKSERDRGELTTVHLLSNMIHALKDCVSALRERKHDALLNEILIIKLWACHPVRCLAMQAASLQRCRALQCRLLTPHPACVSLFLPDRLCGRQCWTSWPTWWLPMPPSRTRACSCWCTASCRRLHHLPRRSNKGRGMCRKSTQWCSKLSWRR